MAKCIKQKTIPDINRENKDVYWADRPLPEAGPLPAKTVYDVMKKL